MPVARRLAFAYCALALAVVAVVLITERSPAQAWVQRYGPNLAVDLFGVLVALVVVERILSWQRSRELAPIAVVARHRTGRAFTTLVAHFQGMYKAAAGQGTEAPQDWRAVVDGWRSVIERLDFRGQSGHLNHETFASLVSAETRRLQAELESVLDRYAEPLGGELVVALEDLFADPIWSLLRNAETIETSQRRLIDRVSVLLLLYSPGDEADLDTFHARLCRAFVALEATGIDLPVSAIDWQDDHEPVLGSSRFDGEVNALPITGYLSRHRP
jgi:hypothetical protein